jgi:cytochrome b
MSKAGTKSNIKQSAAKRHAAERSNDRAVYISMLIVGAFILVLMWATMEGSQWMWGIVGMLLATCILINLYTFRIIRGGKLSQWQRSLAKIPLRFVGYGTKGGKPIDAAKGEDAAKMVLYVTAALSVLLVLGAWALVSRFAVP